MRDNNEESKHSYYWLKSRGICVHCGKNMAREGRVACVDCGSKLAAAEAKRRERQTPAERDERSKKAVVSGRIRKKRLLAAGLCVVCGKRPHSANRQSCTICAEKKAAYFRERYAKMKGKVI